MDCSRSQELLSDHLEETLHQILRAELDRHLAECEECRTLREALGEVVDALHRFPELEPPAGLAERVAAGAYAIWATRSQHRAPAQNENQAAVAGRAPAHDRPRTKTLTDGDLAPGIDGGSSEADVRYVFRRQPVFCLRNLELLPRPLSKRLNSFLNKTRPAAWRPQKQRIPKIVSENRDMKKTRDQLKKQAAMAAVDFIKPGMIIGLGSGSTVRFALEEIGKE